MLEVPAVGYLVPRGGDVVGVFSNLQERIRVVFGQKPYGYQEIKKGRALRKQGKKPNKKRKKLLL